MEEWYSEISLYIREHEQQIVSDLMDLVRIPSVAKHGADGLPFGKEVDHLLIAAS